MIICITGAIGTGKTTWAVSQIMNGFDGLFDKNTVEHQQIFYNHIRGLNARDLKAIELTDDEIKSKPIHELVPSGSIVLVDECDYIYPNMGVGKEIPDYIKTLKEIRHHNITLILITQDVTFVNSYIRKLINKHLHIKQGHMNRSIYQFQEATSNPSKAQLSATPSKPYVLDKKAQAMFQSTSTGKHLNLKLKKPWQLYLLFAIICVSGYLCWNLYSTKFKPAFDGGAKSEISDYSDFNIHDENKHLTAASESVSQKSDSVFSVDSLVPVLLDRPETAPIYDSVRVVTQLEQVAGVVKNGSECTAYSSQGSILRTVSNETCLRYVRDGLPFNAYKVDSSPVQVSPSPTVSDK